METFELADQEAMFAFVFRLYNFASLAKDNNDTLDDPNNRISTLHTYVKNLNLPGLSSLHLKRKTRDNDDGGNGPSKRPTNAGGQIGSAILSDLAILGALKRAGYTFPAEDEDFIPILRVRVSFP